MRRPSAPVFIALLLALCAALVGWQRLAENRGATSLPAGAAFGVLRFSNRVLDGLGGWLSDVGRVMVRRGGILHDNEELRGRVADLEGQNQRLLRYRGENEELRKLLKMPKSPGGSSIPANVIAQDATDYARTITLDVGSRRGVRPKDVVYVAQGVVGKVEEVSPFSSRVWLLTDREMGRAGAMTARTLARGILKGSGENLCRLDLWDFSADAREGDLVVTSGLSDIFPKGLVLGRVTRVRRDPHYSALSADVEPAAPFDRLSAVYVRVGAGP